MKKLLSGLAIMLSIFGVGLASAGAAAASGTVYDNQEATYVDGAGLWVNYTQGYANYGWYGHVEMYGPGYHFNGSEVSNPRVTLYTSRNFNNNSYLCSVGWRYNGGSNWTHMGQPCVMVWA